LSSRIEARRTRFVKITVEPRRAPGQTSNAFRGRARPSQFFALYLTRQNMTRAPLVAPVKGEDEAMRSQTDKAMAFRALHERPGVFIIPNPWDVGTARLLSTLGFEALATTSLGLANTLGRADSVVTRGEVIANCRDIASATDLPVNADLENCFAHAPEAAAETIRLAAEAGAVGGSIEDFTGDEADPIYDLELSVARVRAATEVAHRLPMPFLITARAENLLHGRNDMADTIRRLQAYEGAGADVLYAPGLRNLGEVRQVVGAVKHPINVVTGWLDPDITAAQLAEAGVKRISVGAALSRLALATFMNAARAMQAEGSFAWMRQMVSISELRRVFAGG
jgi:2-methylisocitrate lyase-like PEP mutase family enzyme